MTVYLWQWLSKGYLVNTNLFVQQLLNEKKALSFSEFKVALNSFEETQKCAQTDTQYNVMKVGVRSAGSKVRCYNCGEMGYKCLECKKIA